ncbi:sensor protein [Thecamonas trahens ATCC 50062]|uniref:histidine kinase n=1 Tax=Thecamonas trahens ATCC 50062 TaxID=461836 RepID=A0A0L0DRF4_THETB|nr:sensor protein [Thecamonas trahens ATCC 50062]KNC54842.1 sensor protein [Thecamonas trahens ATCC 50062]|eukprot:XP_013761739.1 sensor protein [Thecamonas trahens ATCC 50062]
MSGDPSEYSVVAEALKRFGRPELLSLAKVAELRNDVLPLITAEQLASLAGLPLGVAVHIVASVASSTAAGASTTAGATAAAGKSDSSLPSLSRSVSRQMTERFTVEVATGRVELAAEESDGKSSLPQLWTSGRNHAVVRVNAAALEMLGAGGVDELEGKVLADLVPPEYGHALVLMQEGLQRVEGVYGPVRIEVAVGSESRRFMEHSAIAMDDATAMHLFNPVDVGSGSESGTAAAAVQDEQTARLLLDVFSRAGNVHDKTERGLEIVGRRLGVDMAIFSRVVDEVYEVMANWDASGGLKDGMTFPLGNTYCSITLATASQVSIPVWSSSPYRMHPCFEAFQLEAYIGTPVESQGKTFGTVNFTSKSPRAVPFTEGERYVVKLLAMLVGRALDEAALDQALADLAALNDSLDLKVQERTAALEVMAAKAREASEAKSHFLGVVSHEIRTPLHGMSAMIDFLHDTQLDETQTQFVDTARSEVANLRTLVESILTFTRASDPARELERGQLALGEVVRFKPGEMLEQAVRVLEPKAAEVNVQLRLELGRALKAGKDVAQARGALSRICLNLVENGIKYRRKSGVEPFVTISGGLKAGKDGQPQLVIQVHDNGVGMSQAVKDTAFEPFSQGRMDHQREYGGLGLGLSIVKQLADAMGGSIELISDVGLGTTVTVTVPAQAENSNPDANEHDLRNISAIDFTDLDASTEQTDEDEGDGSASPAAVGSDGKPLLKVLMVDDVLTNRLIVSRMLMLYPDASCDVMEAVDGTKALKQIRALLPSVYDVILMDVSMPLMNGLDATRHIREIPEYADVPIIGVSAAAAEKECLEAGMTFFLAKPFSHEVFAAVLRANVRR